MHSLIFAMCYISQKCIFNPYSLISICLFPSYCLNTSLSINIVIHSSSQQSQISDNVYKVSKLFPYTEMFFMNNFWEIPHCTLYKKSLWYSVSKVFQFWKVIQGKIEGLLYMVEVTGLLGTYTLLWVCWFKFWVAVMYQKHHVILAFRDGP